MGSSPEWTFVRLAQWHLFIRPPGVLSSTLSFKATVVNFLRNSESANLKHATDHPLGRAFMMAPTAQTSLRISEVT